MAVSDGSMVPLQHDGIFRGFGDLHVGTRAAVDFDVLLYREPVVQNADASCVLDLLPTRVEARPAEPDLEGLPRLRCIIKTCCRGERVCCRWKAMFRPLIESPRLLQVSGKER